MSVIKSWVNAGKRRTSTTDHDMREWAQTMDWIVQELFDMPPLLKGHKNIQKQVSNPQLTWLREVCIQADHDGKLDNDLLAHNIAELCEESDIKYPNNKTYQNDAANKYIGSILGKIFSKQDSVINDNYQVTRTERMVYSESSSRDLLSKIYRINLISCTHVPTVCSVT